MQTLALNRPHKRTRAMVAVQHLCTAHTGSGYVIAASLQVDPDAEPASIEAAMVAAGTLVLPRAYRKNGRIWSASEFEACLDSLLKQRGKVASTPEFEQTEQLAHIGGLVRQHVL